MAVVFRRVNNVPADTVNLAYVAVPEQSAEDLVSIEGAISSSNLRRGRIMYSDLVGRLRTWQGEDVVSSSHPIITDIFYDKDMDKILDESEAIPSRALPYYYKARKYFYARRAYAYNDSYNEYVTGSGTAGSISASSATFTDSTKSWTNDSLIGLSLKITDTSFTEESRYFLITDNNGTTITAEREFASTLSSLDYEIVDLSRSGHNKYSLGAGQNIQLIDANGDQYSGSYMILIEPAYETNKVVTAGTSEYDLSIYENMTSYIVHLYLDIADENIWLNFDSGDLAPQGDDWVPTDIIPGYKEKVEATEFFRYYPMETVIDPVSAGRKIVASQANKSGYYIYTTDKAIVDERPIDPFSWRIKVTIPTQNSVVALGKDNLRVGVIGDVPTNLRLFLDKDGTWTWRMNTINPHPVGTTGGADYWKVNTGAPNFSWQDYDLVIVRGSQIDWNILARDLLQVTGATGSILAGYSGVVLIDTSADNPVINDSSIGSEMLNVNVRAASATSRILNGSFWTNTNVFEVPEGFDLTDVDLINGCYKASVAGDEATWYGECPAIDISHLPDASSRLLMCESSNGVPNAQKAYITRTSKDRVILSTIGFTNMHSDACKQIFCDIVWGFGAQEPTSTSSSFNTTVTHFSPWEGSWAAGTDTDGECILSSGEMDEYDFREVEEPSTGYIRYIRRLSDKTAQQICLDTIPAIRGLMSASTMSAATYELEIGGNNGNIGANAELKANDIPEAWSTRDNIVPWKPGPAYKIGSYLETAQSGQLPKPPSNYDVEVQVVGTRVDCDQYEFTWNTTQDFIYETGSTSTREETITNASGLIDFVTTWSDKEWCAPNVMNDHNPLSHYNLTHYAQSGVTKWKYYPWDGHSMLLSLGSSGEKVKYIQRALNELSEVGKGPRTGKLKVDGNYGAKTDAAVRSYQSRWTITADGDIDAGTAGHIMRVANSSTNWSTLDDIWKKYGPCSNMTDGSDSTMHGRRTWINTGVSHMTDSVYIYLKEGVRIKKVIFEPHLHGSGAAEKLHVYRIGGRVDNTKNMRVWGYDRADNMSKAFAAHSDKQYEINLNISRKLDCLIFAFMQNNSYNGAKAKMWAIKQLNFVAVKTTGTVVEKEDRVVQSVTSVKLRTGDNGRYTIVATPPAGGKFIGWKKTAEEIRADIIASILPVQMVNFIEVQVTVEGNTIVVDFTATNEQDPSDVTVGLPAIISVNPKNRYAWDLDDETGTVTTSGTNVQVIDSGKNWVADSLSGGYVIITNGAKAGQKRLIVDNTSTTITVDTAFTSSPSVNDRYLVLRPSCGHYPSMANKDNPDSAYEIYYSVRVLSGGSRVNGVFIQFADAEHTIPLRTYTTLTATELERIGYHKIRIGVINNNLYGLDTVGGTDKYPVRYAMKPFCVIETSDKQIVDIDGLTGDQASEIWGIRVEASTVNRILSIEPDSFITHSDDINRVDSDYQWLLSAVGAEAASVEATYRITSLQYSNTYGEPYIDITDELAVWSDVNEIQVSKTPLFIDDDGTSPISLSHGSATLAVKSFDVSTGKIEFTVTSGTVNMGDAITVDYVYRESYVDYIGACPDTGDTDIFDVCPYSGHVIDIDGSTYDTYSLAGRPIYVYLLPTTLRVGTQYRYQTRCIYHTLRSDIFDSTSEYYNPLAIKIATVTIKDVSGTAKEKPILIDTRSGGGGLIESEIDNIRKNYPELVHYSGFNELESLYDIGHLDGTAYMKGGSVILRLPQSWKNTWMQLGRTEEEIDTMIRDFADRWVPPGKTFDYFFDGSYAVENVKVYDTFNVWIFGKALVSAQAKVTDTVNVSVI